jgi:small GTP-binding protein
MLEQGYEFLCDHQSGSVSVIRFYNKTLFKKFEKTYIEYKNESSISTLKYAVLNFDDSENEDILISFLSYPELHIHGGIANKDKMQSALNQLQQNLPKNIDVRDELLSRWEQVFSKIKGRYAIEYLLKLKENEFKFDYDEYDCEGYEYIKPIKISLVGPPNAGKSTLFNYMLGTQRAIVSPIEGTTRDVLSAFIEVAGFEVELIDTAGLFENTDGLDSIHLESQRISKECVESSDFAIVFNCLLDENMLAIHKQITVSSKCDLGESKNKNSIEISCHKEIGIDKLYEEMSAKIKSIRGANVSPQFCPDYIK